MKSLARAHVGWPNIDQQIEQWVHNCDACQGLPNQPLITSLHPWTWPDSPWKQIHINFVGPFMSCPFMVVMDAHYKWCLGSFPWLLPPQRRHLMPCATCLQLMAFHSSWSLTIVPGPQFTSKEFHECLATNGICLIQSAPYHLQQMGLPNVLYWPLSVLCYETYLEGYRYNGLEVSSLSPGVLDNTYHM